MKRRFFLGAAGFIAVLGIGVGSYLALWLHQVRETTTKAPETPLIDQYKRQQAQEIFDQANKARNYEDAISLLKKAIVADPSFATPYLYLGECNYRVGRNEEAKENLKEAIRRGENRGVIHAFLSHMAIIDDDMKTARKEIQIALKQDPEDLFIQLIYGHVLFVSKDYAQALEAYKKASQASDQTGWYAKKSLVLAYAYRNRENGDADDGEGSRKAYFDFYEYMNQDPPDWWRFIYEGNDEGVTSAWRAFMKKTTDELSKEAGKVDPSFWE